MRIALIAYHKNIDKIYPKEWIDKFRDSILNQTYSEFDIYEVEYGGGENRIFENSIYESRPFENFVYAMNYLLDKCFKRLGYDYVFNTNVDDFYATNRIEKQLKFLKDGYDLVSSNFSLIDENDKEVHRHYFDKLNLGSELGRNHNIIAHPSVAYSRKFWLNTKGYNPNEIPYEDLKMWKREFKKNRFIIIEDNLLLHRVHEGAVCKSNNR